MTARGTNFERAVLRATRRPVRGCHNEASGRPPGVWTTIGRLFGTTRFARFGSVLMLAGLAILAYSLGAYVGILPGGYTSVPEPVALSAAGQRAARLGEATAVSTTPL